MNISKEKLRNFLNEQYVKQRNKLRDDLTKMIRDNLSLSLYDIPELKEIEKHAKKLIDPLVKWSEAQSISSYSHRQFLQNIDDLTAYRKNIYEKDVNHVRASLLNNQPFNLNVEAKEVIEKIVNDSKPIINRLNELHKLRGEVGSVVDVSRTGKQAYEELKRLGIDLSELEKGNLPALVKLSVNPCVLNGDCK